MLKFTKTASAALALSLSGACALQEIGPAADAANDTTAAAVTAAAVQSGLAPGAAARIEADVAYLADDAREGREAGTSGYEVAAAYVAERMAALGLTPGGDDGWFQQVPLRAGVTRQDEVSLSVTGPDGETQVLNNLGDYRLYPSVSDPSFEITAPAIFIGYGVHAPEAGHDDFAGLNLDGKVVVYFAGAPDSFESEQRAHYGSGSLTRKEAAKRGAIGAITLLTTSADKRSPWARRITNPQSASKTWVGPDGEADIAGSKIKGSAVMNINVSQVLFEGAPRSFEDVLAEADAEGGAPKGFDLAVTVSMKGALDIKDVTSPNVVGVIPGSDPALKDEYVVLTAHLDHVGVNERFQKEGKDGIHNGAMDNALGVATMLEAARRLVDEASLARSVIILAVTAEEDGLLGADYYAHFPTVPIESIVANVNLDMPLVLHSFTDVIAFGAERSGLGPIVATAAEEAGVKLSPDPIPEQGLFTRSDHYRFVEKGVPSVFLVVGFENGGEEKFQEFITTHYHKPTDDISLPILYEDAARFADVNYEIARAVANAPSRPIWNEGDFFGDLFAGK
ncbi:MAG: M28 family metallopeptidase [Pseudomonadota bacterium]